MVETLNKENLQTFINESNDKPVILDFYADWCGPCKITLPRYEEASSEVGDRAKFVKVNVEDNREIAMNYKISSIPCFVVLKNGVEAARILGAQSKESLVSLVSKHI